MIQLRINLTSVWRPLPTALKTQTNVLLMFQIFIKKKTKAFALANALIDII